MRGLGFTVLLVVGGQCWSGDFNEYITLLQQKCQTLIRTKIYLSVFSDMIGLDDIFNKGFISQCNSDQLDSINLQINQNYQISVLMFDHFDSLVLCLR